MHGQIDSNIIREIKEKTDIVDIVSEQVRLEKKGKHYFGRCPFHLEDTPSFSVSRERQMYYCFGCHAGGDALAFVMHTKGLSFVEAAENLAERIGVKLTTQELTGPEKKRFEEKEALMKVNQLAAQWFSDQLHSSQGQNAYLYLKQRQIDDETIENFQIGYSPEAWDGLTSYLINKGYSEEILVKGGLSIKGKGTLYDRFRNRVIFPITDYRGKVIAFGGRVLDDSQPKYLNSPETPVFIKSQNLYGLSLAAQAIRQQNNAVLVEGYMDVVTCHKHGINNAVASLGTALTPEQGKLLLRYTDQLYFAYDSDSAGKKAVQKGIFTLTELGVQLKVLTYKDAKDPDEFLKKHSQKEFKDLMLNAQNGYSFLLDQAISYFDLKNPTEKAKVLKEVFPYIARIKDAVIREGYLKQTAFAISVSEEAVFKEFRKFEKKLFQDVNFSQNFGKNTHVNTKEEKKQLISIEKFRGKILALAIQDESHREQIKQQVNFPFSEDEEENNIFMEIIQAQTTGEALIMTLPENTQSVARALLFDDKYSIEGKETLDDLIAFIRKQYLKRRLDAVDAQLANYASATGINQELKDLFKERQQLQQQLK